jgi:hypothetical protein
LFGYRPREHSRFLRSFAAVPTRDRERSGKRENDLFRILGRETEKVIEFLFCVYYSTSTAN